MIRASADAFAKDYDKLNAMFERICSPISDDEQKRAIGFFFGVRNEQMKKFTAIKTTSKTGGLHKP